MSALPKDPTVPQRPGALPEILLVDCNHDLIQRLEEECASLPEVRIHWGEVFDRPVDALVSPANSFGFMDGGIDAVYTRRFGPGVQELLQRRIDEVHGGELLVGQADVVPTGDADFPWLIAAPTMRVPKILRRDSIAPYLALRAALRLVTHGRFDDGSPVCERIRSIGVPGLGTGVGEYPLALAARQVRTAIEEARAKSSFPQTWREASRRHQNLYADRVGDSG